MHHRAISKFKNCFASRSNQIARCSPGTHSCASAAYGCAIPGARSELSQHSCCVHTVKCRGGRFQLLWDWKTPMSKWLKPHLPAVSQRPVEITPPSYLVRVQFHLILFLKTWDKENAFLSSMCITILWNTNLASSQLVPVTLKTFSLCLPSSCILGYKKFYKWRNGN